MASASNWCCLLYPDFKSPTVSTMLFGMVTSCVLHSSVFCLAIKAISPGSHTVKDFLYPSECCFFSLWSEIPDFNTLKPQPQCLPSSTAFSYCFHQSSMAGGKPTVTHSICIHLLHHRTTLRVCLWQAVYSEQSLNPCHCYKRQLVRLIFLFLEMWLCRW